MFITENDLKLGIYKEKLDAITREDANHIQENILSSLAEIDTYLNGIYNTDLLWAQTGTERNALIKRLAIHISLYNICCPLEEIPASIVDNYEGAVKMLEKIRDGKNILKGVPRGIDENGDGEIDETETNDVIVSGGINNRY